jgi:hypothetical protein
MRKLVPRPYETADKIRVLNILILCVYLAGGEIKEVLIE